MNLDQVIRELRSELADMNRAIASLEELITISSGRLPGKRRAHSGKASRGRAANVDLGGSSLEEHDGAD